MTGQSPAPNAPRTFRIEITIQPADFSIRAVQNLFRDIYTELQYPSDLLLGFEIAIEECMVYLFEYALDKRHHEPLHISVTMAADEVIIFFEAMGRPFDLDRIAKYEDRISDTHTADEGLGLFLLQRFMDTVSWKYIEKKGQQIVITKAIASQVDIIDLIRPADEGESSGAMVSPVQFDGSKIVYRVVSDYNDAFSLASCAYDLYHYNYKEVIYYPGELLKKNLSGVMRSWIAVDSLGFVYGHYSVMKKAASDPVAELGAAFVRPEYRRFGIMKDLARHLHDDLVNFGLKGVFSLSVTNITATQKISESFGRLTVGIRVASSPAIFVDGAAEGERITTVLNYHQLVPRSVRDVYIAPLYRDIVAYSYDLLGIPVSIDTTGSEETTDYFDSHHDTSWNRALISARGGGVICQKLEAFTDMLKESGVAFILLSVDICDPGAVRLAETAQRLGYFYSGIFPESFHDGHDAIQMQYLNGITVDPAAILIYQASGSVIFDFIKAEAPHVFRNSNI